MFTYLYASHAGSHLPAGKKSLAYTLTYQDKTFDSQDQVNAAFDKVTAYLQDKID